MLYRNNGMLYVFNIFAMVFLLVGCISCAGSIKGDDPSLNSRLLAENSSIKKRLPLIERENDILSRENHQNRTKIQDLETKIEKLGSELTLLNEKYAADMAADEEQIEGLQLAIQEIEKESTEKIEKLTKEVQARNDLIVTQKEAFDRERDQMVQENANRELALSRQIDDLKNTIAANALEKASLETAVSEISSKLDEQTALAQALSKARDEAMAELETVKTLNAELTQKLNGHPYAAPAKNSPFKSNQ
jgi:chromosome segregation ATPase